MTDATRLVTVRPMLRLLVIAATAGGVVLLGREFGTDGRWFITLGLMVIAAGTIALEAISRYGK